MKFVKTPAIWFTNKHWTPLRDENRSAIKSLVKEKAAVLKFKTASSGDFFLVCEEEIVLGDAA